MPYLRHSAPTAAQGFSYRCAITGFAFTSPSWSASGPGPAHCPAGHTWWHCLAPPGSPTSECPACPAYTAYPTYSGCPAPSSRRCSHQLCSFGGWGGYSIGWTGREDSRNIQHCNISTFCLLHHGGRSDGRTEESCFVDCPCQNTWSLSSRHARSPAEAAGLDPGTEAGALQLRRKKEPTTPTEGLFGPPLPSASCLSPHIGKFHTPCGASRADWYI